MLGGMKVKLVIRRMEQMGNPDLMDCLLFRVLRLLSGKLTGGRAGLDGVKCGKLALKQLQQLLVGNVSVGGRRINGSW
jgi:hypothetical protein